MHTATTATNGTPNANRNTIRPPPSHGTLCPPNGTRRPAVAPYAADGDPIGRRASLLSLMPARSAPRCGRWGAATGRSRHAAEQAEDVAVRVERLSPQRADLEVAVAEPAAELFHSRARGVEVGDVEVDVHGGRRAVRLHVLKREADRP